MGGINCTVHVRVSMCVCCVWHEKPTADCVTDVGQNNSHGPIDAQTWAEWGRGRQQWGIFTDLTPKQRG